MKVHMELLILQKPTAYMHYVVRRVFSSFEGAKDIATMQYLSHELGYKAKLTHTIDYKSLKASLY
jgi:hypothetical protein